VLIISESPFQLHKDSVNTTHNLPIFITSSAQNNMVIIIFKKA